MSERFLRSYPLKVQAQAFIDGASHSGTGWAERLQIREESDRLSPSGKWFQVFDVYKTESAWEYRCERCNANLAYVEVNGSKLPRVSLCDKCSDDRVKAHEARLQAAGFEPVSEERRAENLLVNLGIAK